MRSTRGGDYYVTITDAQNQTITDTITINQASEISLSLYTPNEMCKMRADTFSTKEPEILKWIDEHGSESSFWDIGANIGLYSIYYAKSKPGSVVSFEPSVFNLKQLAKNITINNLSDKIGLVPIPLSDSSGFNQFIISSFEIGWSCKPYSSFVVGVTIKLSNF